MLDLDLQTSYAAEPIEFGEVFTRTWIVEFILDLAGYTADRRLHEMVVVEPSCGDGAFLGPIIDRLIASSAQQGQGIDMSGALRAFDLSALNVERARKLAVIRLVDAGLSVADAEDLSRVWISQGDFLLQDDIGSVDFVLGNPPYIRLENASPSLTSAYRETHKTMRGRSDVYVGFIEKGLRLLKRGAVLGFIVADRWMHNQYGAALRSLVAEQYSVEVVVEMHDTNAFEDRVSAYPAVTLIRRHKQRTAVLATADFRFGARSAKALHQWAKRGRSPVLEGTGFRAARLASWFPGGALWPSGTPAQLALLSDIERRFPPLEDTATGTRVGIGVATGADDVFITTDPECVESDRLLPLVMARDVSRGNVEWSGSMLVNPWADGQLVDLEHFPRLASFLGENERRLRARYVSLRRPETWYRTIDRVAPSLLAKAKLLVPDIKAASHPVIDTGKFYPHHNLYFVVSEYWDLQVLGGLMLSDIANLFVGAYCVKMRGGCYRFQAQYIRRVRVPHPSTISKRHARALALAFEQRDRAAATATAMKLYGIAELPTST
jgi:hypothetical protein